MKLIDLLVQHLGNNGGWPIGAEICAQDNDCEVVFYSAEGIHRRANNLVWTIPEGVNSHVVKRRIFIASAEDLQTAIVSRGQYESALAASQQPAWSGDGLPPVGCECEVKSGKESWTLCKVVHSSSAGVAFIYLEEPSPELSSKYMGVIDSFPHRHAGDYFRPIRTEEDRKRDEAIKFMNEVFRDHVDNKKTNGQTSVFHAIYDAFKSGKFE